MNTLIIFDRDFKVDKSGLLSLLNENCNYLKFTLGDDVLIDSDVLIKPNSFNSIIEQLDNPLKKFDRIFCLRISLMTTITFCTSIGFCP